MAVLKRKTKDPTKRVARENSGIQFETISATVPKEIVREVRAQSGKRGFSRFVAGAIARELIRRRRDEFVAAAEREHGPVDEKRLRAVIALLEA